MKIGHYTDSEGRRYEGGAASGVTGRVAVGRADGAENFCMRVFEVESGGHTPRHRHDWEHEIFFHEGEGEIWREREWVGVSAGCVAFIPGGTEHQIRNTGEGRLTFVCLIPSGPPEL